MLDANTVRANNPATQAVIDRLSGTRTREQIVAEFYGLAPEDFASADALVAKDVRYHPRLADFGIDAQEFSRILARLCPTVTFPLDYDRNPARSAATLDGGIPARAARKRRVADPLEGTL